MDWAKGLNPEQRLAVLHTRGPLLILAGAGSGKTTVLVSRTGHILENEKVKASEICVLTFTTKAARELKHRVAARIGSQAEGLMAGTFHSFGLNLLRKYHVKAGLPSGFGVIDQGDSTEIVKEFLSQTKNSAKDAFKADRLLSIINAWRAEGRREPRNESDEYEVMAQALLPKYLRRLESLGVEDFEGLLLKPLELMAKEDKIRHDVQSSFQFVMVDEFQDTNVPQFELVRLLADQSRNLAVVGDDDQSIYGWRGACVTNILGFPSVYRDCEVVRLERNYRSTPAILRVANHVIEKNENRHGKILRANPEADLGPLPEVFVYENDDQESEEVASQIRHFLDQGFRASDIAVLYRSNGQGGMIEAQLRRNQIPYAITGGPGFFDRKETKDVLAYLRCALSPNEIAFRRVINAPSRGIGETTIDRIAQHANVIGFKFHIAARKWREAGVSDKIGPKIDEFIRLIDHFAHDILTARPDLSVGDTLLLKLREMGYRDYLLQTCKEPQALEKKWLVIEIFARVLDAFINKGERNEKTIQEFVDAMEIRDSGLDDKEEENKEKVQLLTLHACKGLEFPVVILVGCEEELIPHRTLGTDTAEERRLFYVGLTRAKQNLVLTRARTRKRFGKWAPSAPSRFLLEIPGDYISSFETGFRPVNEGQRKSMLAGLFQKLEVTAKTQKIEK